MKRILITDHDYAVRLLFQMELQDEGYIVSTTDDYENLIDRVKRFGPHLVLFDVSSGEVDELEIYRKLRNKFYRMPIILCSSYASILHELKSIALDGAFVKSINMSKLKDIVKMAFENASEEKERFVSNSLVPQLSESCGPPRIPEDFGMA